MQQVGRAAIATMATAASASVGGGGGSGGSCVAPYQQRISSLAASIQPRVLVSTRGSGNYGESGSAAFYTIDESSFPSALREMSTSTRRQQNEQSQSQQLARVDLDL